MVCHTDVLFDSKYSAEFLHEVAGKLGVFVQDDFLRDPVMWYDVLGVELGNSFRVNGFFAEDKDGSF